MSLNGVTGLDIDMEKKKVEEKLNELREEGATQHDIELAMKDLGSKRFVTTSILMAPTSFLLNNLNKLQKSIYNLVCIPKFI